MPNIRFVYDNRADALTLNAPDAYPSIGAETMQHPGRMHTARLKQIRAAGAFTGTATLGGATYRPSGFTISVWMYRTGALSPGGSIIKVEPVSGNLPKTLELRDSATNSVVASFYDGSTNTTITSGASALTLNTWIHVAATWASDDSLRFYVNGSLIDTDATSGVMTLGSDGQAALQVAIPNMTNLRIARLRLDARQIDASEVAALAAHRFVADDALADRWAFDDSLIGDYGTTISGAGTYYTGPGASATTNVVQIKGNWAANETISCVALVRTNFSASTTVRVRLYSAVDQGGSTLYDSNAGGLVSVISGTRTGDYVNVAFYPTGVTTARSILVEINNSGTPVDVARLVAGAYFEPARNPAWGARLVWMDTGMSTRTEGGAVVAEPGAIFRALDCDFIRVPTTDQDAWSALLYSAGQTREAFVSLYPAESNSQREIDYSMCGYLSAAPVTSEFPTNNSLQLRIEEG